MNYKRQRAAECDAQDNRFTKHRRATIEVYLQVITYGSFGAAVERYSLFLWFNNIIIVLVFGVCRADGDAVKTAIGKLESQLFVYNKNNSNNNDNYILL